MPSTKTFKVYTGKFLSGWGRATVITTSTIIDKTSYAQFFAFLESDDFQYEELEISCDFSGVPSEVAAADYSTVDLEILSHAEQRLSRSLREYYKKIGEDYRLREIIKLEPNEDDTIIGLIMRNRFPDKIARIKHITKSEDLRQFLDQNRWVPKRQYHDRID
ncbi:MAG: hypothetical protein ABSF90_29130 [Syntrophobacteraceae bacterium]|jgi:hypothetical protein